MTYALGLNHAVDEGTGEASHDLLRLRVRLGPRPWTGVQEHWMASVAVPMARHRPLCLRLRYPHPVSIARLGRVYPPRPASVLSAWPATEAPAMATGRLFQPRPGRRTACSASPYLCSHLPSPIFHLPASISRLTSCISHLALRPSRTLCTGCSPSFICLFASSRETKCAPSRVCRRITECCSATCM